MNGRYFCFHTGIGYDAAVVQQVERRGSLKRWLGHPLFIYAGLSTWLTGYDRKHPHFSIDGDGTSTAGGKVDDGYFTIVLNTNPYTYLGNRPLDLSPAATLDRGLVVITFRTMRARRSSVHWPAHLRVAESAPPTTSTSVPTSTHFVAEHPTPFPYQVDGDALGETSRLEFVHVPNAVKLVFPTGPQPG